MVWKILNIFGFRYDFQPYDQPKYDMTLSVRYKIATDPEFVAMLLGLLDTTLHSKDANEVVVHLLLKLPTLKQPFLSFLAVFEEDNFISKLKDHFRAEKAFSKIYNVILLEFLLQR
jgi:hypothetical protein